MKDTNTFQKLFFAGSLFILAGAIFGLYQGWFSGYSSSGSQGDEASDPMTHHEGAERTTDQIAVGDQHAWTRWIAQIAPIAFKGDAPGAPGVTLAIVTGGCGDCSDVVLRDLMKQCKGSFRTVIVASSEEEVSDLLPAADKNGVVVFGDKRQRAALTLSTASLPRLVLIDSEGKIVAIQAMRERADLALERLKEEMKA